MFCGVNTKNLTDIDSFFRCLINRYIVAVIRLYEDPAHFCNKKEILRQILNIKIMMTRFDSS